jgi:aminoglycoside phosphotransferase (APT) family kinase protein
VPEVVAFCDDPAVLGCEFYLMERLRGIILRKDLPPQLSLTPQATRRLCTTVLEQQIALHAIDVAAHPELAALGKGEGYVRRQVTGWSQRFRKARTDNVTDFESVMAWLDAEQPADVASCVIHGDFRFDNVVLAPAAKGDELRVVGVLDWEMATIGDPLMDLGSSLAYWVEAGDEPPWQIARQQPTHLPGMLTRDEVVTYYGARSGRSVQGFDFYLVFGLFRLAVIVQQIYYRYHHGQTQDARFAQWHLLVDYLEQRCRRLIG